MWLTKETTNFMEDNGLRENLQLFWQRVNGIAKASTCNMIIEIAELLWEPVFFIQYQNATLTMFLRVMILEWDCFPRFCHKQ